MSSEFGNKIKVGIFGQSHGKAIGVTIHGLPAGEEIDLTQLQEFMERRRGGKNAMSTSRSEADCPRFLSGLENGKTCGAPLCAVIENSNTRSGDYDELKFKPRPGHADYTAFVKWNGEADMRGGGHFSGRLTAPLCVAGGIAKQILARRGIYVGAHLSAVAGIEDEAFPLFPDEDLFNEIAAKSFPVIDDEKGEEMISAILLAKEDGDSVGGIIECATVGLPAGLGEPMFGGIENRIAAAIFGIPAIKGIEFGAGFAASAMRGSENNDAFCIEDGEIITETNNCGGILGGITNAMPVVFRVAVKPTPSIAKRQTTVDLECMAETTLEIKGRHDPCIAQRAVPVVEAVAAIVLLDMLLEEQNGY
ncbi:MAG: chorismate synthase [Oscillospiraceae bacterium]|nr:chorismate synthase [Oscillospiraceae bacterium]